jgi:hypothetical protein
MGGSTYLPDLGLPESGGHRIDAVPTTTDDQAKRLVIDHFRDRERESP